MEVVFLGYNDINFDTQDGKHIDGLKFFYYFKSDNPNYVGYEVASQFVSRNRTDLINQIRSIPCGSPAILDMQFNGRRSIFCGIESA